MPTQIQSWPTSKFNVLLEASVNPDRWWADCCVLMPELKTVALAIEPVADQDWVSETQRQFEPFVMHETAAGSAHGAHGADGGDDAGIASDHGTGIRLWVGPTWLTPPTQIAENGVVVRLDPGMAFGTGSHATTQLCLEQLVHTWDRLGPQMKVLDYGCGSGILAVTAATLGAAKVVALDIDPLALDASARNAQENHVQIELIGAEDTPSETFDLVLANILSQPLKVLAPLLASLVRPGGCLVMSGILARQAEEIIATYQPLTQHLGGVRVLAERDGWVAIGNDR
jgi:ribosomal protein L11 methyltransferase